MQLPGEDELDFIQILPFTPANRENMIAWLAVRNDPEVYGQKLVYEFGKDSLVYGPKQVEARIDQDPEISEQLTLWNQQGSSVIRGNLLVIPIGDSLLYVEPLYLQAANGNIPELRRVILATAERVVMAENLGLALAELFGSNILAETGLTDLTAGLTSSAPVAPNTTPTADLSNATVEQLITRANDAFNAAQEALRKGDWTVYGDQMEIVQSALQQLAQLSTPAAGSQ
jgi:uncharacterized membrane protein (UPF0182 family)